MAGTNEQDLSVRTTKGSWLVGKLRFESAAGKVRRVDSESEI